MDKKKILFVGNNITLHEPNTEIGWAGNWGMAASSRDRDYVHILMDQIKEQNPEALYMAKNISMFEQQFWDYDISLLEKLRDFSPDLLIVRIGENVDENEAIRHNFGYFYDALIRYICPLPAGIVCTSCFWPKPNTDAMIRKVSEDKGYLLADLSSLQWDNTNMAIGQYWHQDVARHPSDKGMEKIAGLIWDQVKMV